MGSVHNELKRGPWGPAASAIVGLSRDASGLERLGETLSPEIDIWSAARPDWAIERRESLIWLNAFAAAVAGELSCLVFDAGTDPNNLLIIDRLHVNFGTLQYRIGFDARPPAAVEDPNKDFLDLRSRTPIATIRPRSRVWVDSNAATALTGPSTRYTNQVAGTTVVEGPWIVIGDNLSLIVEGGTVNTAITVSAFGRERTLLPSEQHFG